MNRRGRNALDEARRAGRLPNWLASAGALPFTAPASGW